MRRIIHRTLLAATLLIAPGLTLAGKPGTAQEQEIFYRAPAGKGTQLVAAARDGSNVSSLFSSAGSLSFDVGSADSGLIVITTSAGELQLLRYAKNSNGVFARTGLTRLLTGVPPATAVDLSPDGTRIAYRGGDGTKLMVYTIADGSNVEWSSGPWAWDFAWVRGGASIALLEQTDPIDRRSHLYEVAGPGQRQDILNMRYVERVEASRTQGDLVLLSYNGEDAPETFVGTWRMPTTNPDGTSSPGAWVEPSLAGRAISSRGVLSCDDSYLLYGSAGPAGQQTWYTRTLPSGADQLISKVGSNAEPQSWSSCAGVQSISTDAFRFREVPQ